MRRVRWALNATSARIVPVPHARKFYESGGTDLYNYDSGISGTINVNKNNMKFHFSFNLNFFYRKNSLIMQQITSVDYQAELLNARLIQQIRMLKVSRRPSFSYNRRDSQDYREKRGMSPGYSF